MISAAPVAIAPPMAAVAFDLGVEGRARVEWNSGDHGWGNYRIMPWVKLSAEPLTLFVQPILARSVDEKGRPSPIEQTDLEVLQAYGQVDLPVSGETVVALRAGRTLERLGSERLVGARYGANVPRVFDGVDVSVEKSHAKLKLVTMRQVRSGIDSFDDKSTSDGRLLGAYTTLSMDSLKSTMDLYLLRTHFEAPRFGSIGRSERTTLGLRVEGHASGWSWNWEAIGQAGDATEAKIRSWSVASETSRDLRLFGLPASVRVRANIASGGGTASKSLRNFDPLFPKAKYFGELTPIGPSNMFNLHPAMFITFPAKAKLGISAMAYWRLSASEPAYTLSGQPIAFSRLNNKWIGGELEITLESRLAKGIDGLLSLSRFRSSDDLRKAHSLPSTTLAALELSFEY